MTSSERIISTILKHDSKVTSYKIALLRAINDVVLSYPDLRSSGHDVAVPLRVLAEFWLAYYWPFADPVNPVMQGPRARLRGQLRNDISFRGELTGLRRLWEEQLGGASTPADGFYIINEMRIPRRRIQYSKSLQRAYDQTLTAIVKALQQPIQYAGPGHWSVFDKPRRYKDLPATTAVPGTNRDDFCLVVTADLWQAFQRLSLWVEALCIHEWSLFTERVEQPDGTVIDRGLAYVLLTVRPDNRRPLTWERNQVDLLLMEGYEFFCPWTKRPITQGSIYELDHIVPVSVYPTNELWNLVPADPDFNAHDKRDRLPSLKRLGEAEQYLVHAYNNYDHSPRLAQALREDVSIRFSASVDGEYARGVAAAVIDFVGAIADARNLAQF